MKIRQGWEGSSSRAYEVGVGGSACWLPDQMLHTVHELKQAARACIVPETRPSSSSALSRSDHRPCVLVQPAGTTATVGLDHRLGHVNELNVIM
jgi:hypothetical protein